MVSRSEREYVAGVQGDVKGVKRISPLRPKMDTFGLIFNIFKEKLDKTTCHLPLNCLVCLFLTQSFFSALSGWNKHCKVGIIYTFWY